MDKIPGLSLAFSLLLSSVCAAQPPQSPVLRVGVTSILSGDLAVLGQNIVDTVETYRKCCLRHPIDFVYEDAKLNSRDGLSAYQKLITINKVGLIIAASSSNGTMAAKSLIDKSKTPTISVVTGGRNIDRAGPFIFRIGNSDTLNGYQQAEAFKTEGISEVALLTEETEYTQDISWAFKERFRELEGVLVYEQNFLPGESDFRTQVAAVLSSGAKGVLMLTQTGTPLGVFVKQWFQMGGTKNTPIHTTFVAAPNPDAHRIAGRSMEGVYYMAPLYDEGSPSVKEFFSLYRGDHGRFPPIGFHTAGTVDALNLLQNYLDTVDNYSNEGFQRFLASTVKDYQGLMGRYSLDIDGNSDLGFQLARITKEDIENMR